MNADTAVETGQLVINTYHAGDIYAPAIIIAYADIAWHR